MASFISRAGALGPFLTATTQTVPSVARVAAVPVVAAEKPVVLLSGRRGVTPEAWANNAITAAPRVTSGIGGLYTLSKCIASKFARYFTTGSTLNALELEESAGYSLVVMLSNLSIDVLVTTHSSQRRYAHTDIRFPDFGGYKKDDKFRVEEGAREGGKVFTYVMVGGKSSSCFVLLSIMSLLL